MVVGLNLVDSNLASLPLVGVMSEGQSDVSTRRVETRQSSRSEIMVPRRDFNACVEGLSAELRISNYDQAKSLVTT